MKLSLDDAKRHWQQAGVDPTSVSFSGPSIANADPTPEELRKLATALAHTKGTDAHQHAQAMLIAALGTTVTHRILDKSQLRERWSQLIEAVRSGPPQSKEVTRSDAIRLSRELCSGPAQALRLALAQSFTSPEGLDEAITSARANGLSFGSIQLILKDLYPHLGRTTQQRMDDLLREARIEEELRGLFQNAGDATYLREVPVSSLIRDEALFLDGFEVFIQANDRALKLITEISQFAADALQDGRDFTAHSGGATLSELAERLEAEVARMVDWFRELGSPEAAEKCRERFETVMGQLASAADGMERVFATGYQQLGGFDFHQDLAAGRVPDHVAQPYEALIGVCSKSKPTVDMDSIATVEELIRVLHREVAHAFGDHVKDYVKKGLTLRNSHTIRAKSPHTSASLSLTYVGSCSEKSFSGTPMGAVRDALVSYIESGRNNHQEITNGVITDKTMAFDVTLGCHVGRLNVTYDSAHDLYFVEWGLQEPKDGRGRLEFCPSYFAKAGFEHTIDGWKHYARKKVSPEDIHRIVWFMMFSLENMSNVDISTPVFDQKALLRLFDGWYENQNPSSRKSSVAHETDEVLSAFPKWNKMRKTICSRMLDDPHLFRVAEMEMATHGGSNNLHAFAVFMADHAAELFGANCTPAKMSAVYRAVAEVYFDAVQPLILSELKELGMEPKSGRVGWEDASQQEADRIRGAKDLDEATRRLREGSQRTILQGPVYQRTR